MIALDASALLAFLFRETGHEQVSALLATACLSTVNLAEVMGRFVRDGHDARPIPRLLSNSGLEIVPFTATDASLAASLLPVTRPLGLSLGDRACLALALSRGIAALTADRVWADLDIGVTIHLIRS
jgi:PIN domain nuclease of toxin-antitoxin system